MKKTAILFFSFLSSICVAAQYKVSFLLKEETFSKYDSIYIAGNFNNWDSIASNHSRLIRNSDGRFSITFTLKPGSYYYKYHRKNWLSVEKKPNGDEVSNRTFLLNRDTIFNDTVFAWRDNIIADRWRGIAEAGNDSTRLSSFLLLARIYGNNDWYQPDSSLYYVSKALLLLQEMKSGSVSSRQKNSTLHDAQDVSANILGNMGNFFKVLELRLDNLKLATELNDPLAIANDYGSIAATYMAMQDYNNALVYEKKLSGYILQNENKFKDKFLFLTSLSGIADVYIKLNQPDSALYYAAKIDDSSSNPYGLDTSAMWTRDFVKATKNQLLGDIYFKTGMYSLAMEKYKSVLSTPNYAAEEKIRSRYGIAQIYYRKGKTDSAFIYGKSIIQEIENNISILLVQSVNTNTLIAELGPFVAELYKAVNKPDSAYHVLQLSLALKDSLFNLDKIRQFQSLSFNESLRAQQREQEIRMTKQQYESKVRTYILITGLGLLSLLAFVLYRNNKQQQKAKTKIEKAYSELKSTQQQLIQSEKMASLGELTAGIAHEIQNPLNFVNNFSEVNKELLGEMKEEMAKGNIDEAKNIADNIIDNEEKINHHGKRADSIVKGMLQHSRTGSGQKELTDINALADEYLRLSYHGLRAKDKSFNATLKTEFDDSIGQISILPQEIGRVLLNLYNNAFYSVNEKKKQLNEKFEPTVSLTTRKVNNNIEITVTDNGNGIPQNVIDKIFQPFFTTKPTGQGTGLGLSISYDIITKGHGGELKVISREGRGSEFNISLPLITTT